MSMRANARITSGRRRCKPYLCRLCPKLGGDVLGGGRIKTIAEIITEADRTLH
jgi:hypothetical protein